MNTQETVQSALRIQNRERMDAEAKSAMEATDCTEMYAVSNKMRAANDSIIDAAKVLLGHFIDSSDKPPRYTEDQGCVTAMRDVALAAIGLAKCTLDKSLSSSPARPSPST